MSCSQDRLRAIDSGEVPEEPKVKFLNEVSPSKGECFSCIIIKIIVATL